jgi:hypothetical protein
LCSASIRCLPPLQYPLANKLFPITFALPQHNAVEQQAGSTAVDAGSDGLFTYF